MTHHLAMAVPAVPVAVAKQGLQVIKQRSPHNFLLASKNKFSEETSRKLLVPV